MEKKFLPILIAFVCLIHLSSFGQYNENTPWMHSLSKDKSFSSKSKDQPFTAKAAKQGFSIYEISESFNQYWKDKDYTEKGSGYKPFKRWENYWLHFADEKGYLPSPKSLWSTWQNSRNAVQAENPVANWSSIGPFETGIQAFGLPGVGRVNAIAVDPNNENIWYVGAPAGGIWKSMDAGVTWDNLFDNFPQIGVSGIAIDPNNSDIIYIATGDDDARDSFSIGVFKSTNGGSTWDPTGLGPDDFEDFDVLNEIFIDPTDSNTLWVGGTRGLLKSENAGDTWEVKQAGNITDFRLKPDDPNTVYAVIGRTTNTGNSDVAYFRSTNGGDTFDEISENLPTEGGRAVIGVSPADPEVVYLLYADIFNCDECFQGLFKSTDGGSTFVRTANTSDLIERDQSWFNLAIAVSPTDANVVFTGAINIWKSINGGDGFSRINNNDTDLTDAYTHVDTHTLKYFGNKLFTGTDGGLFVSEDDGVTFINETAGITISQFYRISVAQTNASRVVGGTQDNSGIILENGQWNVYTGGDGMDYEIDPNNENVVYGFTQFGGFLFISTNFGQSVSFAQAPRDQSGATIQGNWITPLEVATNGEVYAGYDGVYRLNGTQWEELSSATGVGPIEDLETDPNNPDNIYVANDDFIYRSQNGGQTFIPIQGFDTEISSITINKNDGNIIYVTTSRRVGISQSSQPSQRGVFRLTDNGGGSVVVDDLTLNLPTDVAFFSIAHQERDVNNPIYVGTSLGVFRYDDSLTEWEMYSTGLPSVAFSDLVINIDEQVITGSTYGRGIWQSPIPVQLPPSDVRITDALPAQNAVLCEDVVPEVTVINGGTDPITEITVTYTLNSGAPLIFDWTGNLASQASTTIQLPTLNTGDLVIGKNTISFTVSTPNDAFDDNNDLSRDFIFSNPSSGNIVFDFETEENSLATADETGDGSLWERGVPTGQFLNEATSGTQVLGTNLDGDYPDGVKSFIFSGCYDFSSIILPQLKFNMAFELEQNYDIVFVEYTIDDGATWSVLGKLGSQPNWYNSDRTNASSGAADDCQNCPGAQWTGVNIDMTEYAYDFTANAQLGEVDLTQESNIAFRIVFQSDPGVFLEGAIIDDFVVEGLEDDEDDDNDGILDVDDNCPLVANADQLDTDNDGLGNVCDDDDDNDGILDINDNCPLNANADQADDDNDGIGNVCDNDSDNDGVPDTIDLCPDTPEGTVVDVDGCPIFTLPSNNFNIKSTSESCISSNNGSIEVSTSNMLNYTATLTDSASNETVLAFTDTALFENLMSGTYQVCITVEGQTDYELCFDVVISEPEPLSVSSKVNTLDDKVSLTLDGGQQYLIELNGEAFITSESQITLELNKIENVLKVRTDKDCQGTYEETIFLSSKVLIHPNPVESSNVTVYLGSNEFKEVTMALFNVNGSKVYNKKHQPVNGEVFLNISGMAQGIYILNIKTENSLLNYKIIKR